LDRKIERTTFTRQHALPVDFVGISSLHSSMLTTAVEVFDGSGIIDPVVVSSVFWTGLKAKLLSVIIGQVLAVLAFAILSSFAANQIGSVTDFVSKKLFDEDRPRKLKVPPSPSSVAYIAQPDFVKLVFCIAIDVVGSSSELVPFVGEITDVIWAPIAGYALRSLYGSNILFVLEFAEEILPFTDVLPLATICWVVDAFFADSAPARLLQVGRYGPGSGSAGLVIDVQAKAAVTESKAAVTESRKLGPSRRPDGDGD
jgi:hypothetical protein